MNAPDPRDPIRSHAHDGEGSPVRPAVDAAIERLVAAMPLRRPSAALDARIHAMLERPVQPWWMGLAPLAMAAALLLAIGFIAGSWVGQSRLGTIDPFTSAPLRAAAPAAEPLDLVLRDSSVQPAALGTPQSLDLGEDGSVQTAPSLWIRTERFHDPRRGVTIERSFPERWTLVGSPSAD